MLVSKQLLLNYVLKRRPKPLNLLKPLKTVLQDFVNKYIFRRHFRENHQKNFFYV